MFSTKTIIIKHNLRDRRLKQQNNKTTYLLQYLSKTEILYSACLGKTTELYNILPKNIITENILIFLIDLKVHLLHQYDTDIIPKFNNVFDTKD